MVKGDRLWAMGLLVLSLMACTKNQSTQREQVPLRVRTIVVATQSGSACTRYVGTITPLREIPLSVHTSGRVLQITCKDGDRVHKGQVLLRVDSTQAMNTFRSAQAALRQAQDGYDRVNKVHEKGVVSDQKMVEIESQYAQAQSMYDAAKQHLTECTLTAPCDGIISGMTLEEGQTVVPGLQLFSILDISQLSVRFTVPEKEINKLKVGSGKLKGVVECAAVDAEFPITITEKSVTANPVTHTYDVTARINGGKDQLMTGMVAVVKLNGEWLSASDDQIVIPSQCILLKPEGHTVWVVEQGCAQRRAVTIDGYQADGIRLRSGLHVGDTLIIEGYQKLYNNCKVICDF